MFTGIHITTSRTCVINDDNLNPGGAAEGPLHYTPRRCDTVFQSATPASVH